MTDPTTELVARLRATYSHRGDGLATQLVNPDGPEAAARIEELTAQVGREWQDIATAPRDGTDFLAFNAGEWMPNFVATFVPDGRLHNRSRNQWGIATHWRPLPDPPRSTEEME